MNTAHPIRTTAYIVLLCSIAPLALAATQQHRTAPARVPGLQIATDDGLEGWVEVGTEGFAGRVPDSKKPKVTASFDRESFRPGETATLTVLDRAHALSVRFYRTGGENRPTIPRDVMLGTPVGPSHALGDVAGRGVYRLRIGDWPSGVYFAELTSGDRTGYAPFVLAPKRLGEHPIAVVMPTMTWQAYNYRDDDHNGTYDTWYAGFRTTKARLIRPFLDRGVPPHWKFYDAPFVRWLTHTGRAVDYLSDRELRLVKNGDELAKAYTAIVFSGHHEYVTTHEYDVVQRYRDLGGNLAFLSANNFFWKTTLHDDVMTRVVRWRDIGRPEAALIGVQYIANDNGEHRGGWVIRNAESVPWLFAKVAAEDGDRFSSGGIEIDRTAASSPRNVRVIAEIPNLYGPGYTAQMTYYETRAGARVFAAGAFTLAGSVWQPDVRQVMTNIWNRLSTP